MSERTFEVGGWRFPLLATLFTVPALCVLAGLAIWQVERLAWKEGLIADRQARLAMPVVDLPATVDDPAAWAFRPVEVEGVFEHAKEAFLGARSLNGNVGYHVLTPLRRLDGSYVIVNRGWIPLDMKDPAARPDSIVEGPQTIVGVARPSGGRNWLTPEDAPAANFWFVVDIDSIAAAKGIEPVAPVYVEASATPPRTFPIGGQTRSELPNDHLQYAITWSSLTLALLIIFGIYVRRMNRP